ncbi:hypothetical protein QBC46DRAFT_406227 [Diplogelasinospora grovesii]|uniref:Uncharacterized protein n=1 Tax=Diplogelasinospora grovesii TaxID=303347 RepID=A0AAN6NB16_9PEZI|nr:hypothetical protein QBC46DRAFT_406227 [Diplogelasinospora grovesii]
MTVSGVSRLSSTLSTRIGVFEIGNVQAARGHAEVLESDGFTCRLSSVPVPSFHGRSPRCSRSGVHPFFQGDEEPARVSYLSSIWPVLLNPQGRHVYLRACVGGKLGFTCVHAYAHSHHAQLVELHHTLKGVDMIVYQILRHLVGSDSVRVTSVLNETKFRGWRDGPNREYDGSSGELYSSDSKREPESHTTKALARQGTWNGPLLFGDYEDQRFPVPKDLYDFHHDTQEKPFRREKVTWLNYSPNSEAFEDVMAAAFIVHARPGRQTTRVVYGNQPGTDYYYSHAVIIVDLAPREIGPRKKKRKSKNIVEEEDDDDI